MASLALVVVTRDGDPAQFDPFLACSNCSAHLCTVEEQDTLDVLVAVAQAHECGEKA